MTSSGLHSIRFLRVKGWTKFGVASGDSICRYENEGCLSPLGGGVAELGFSDLSLCWIGRLCQAVRHLDMMPRQV